MFSASKLKSVDFYRKIPRDLTEASIYGAGLSIIAALSMIFLFGMELNNYLTVKTETSVIVDRSSDGEFLRIDFNISFPALSCEFASVDVSDILGTNRLNITKTVRKFSIDPHLRLTGSEFHSDPIPIVNNHGDETEGEYSDGSVSLTAGTFEIYSHRHDILVVNFYAPWCYWSNRLKPSWERTAKTIRERYDPEMDGRILMGKVDCTQNGDLCRRHHIQGYPSIRIFRKGSDVKDNHGHHDHESYYGERDTESLVAAMETLVVSVPKELHTLAVEDKSDKSTVGAKRPAPLTSGCRIEGFLRVKKIEHYLQVVKTELVPRKRYQESTPLEEYEYTAHNSLVHSVSIPVAKFHFEPSPMQVLVYEVPKSLSHFITNICAIIGGVFTVAGILDSLLYNTIRFVKKVELGKHF